MATKLTLSATAREIINALRQNKMIIGHFDDGIECYWPFIDINFSESDGLSINLNGDNFSTNNLDDYPSYYISNNPNLA